MVSTSMMAKPVSSPAFWMANVTREPLPPASSSSRLTSFISGNCRATREYETRGSWEQRSHQQHQFWDNAFLCFHRYQVSYPPAFIWSKTQLKTICFLCERILKCNLFLWWEIWHFSIITPVFSVTLSYRKYYNILICCFIPCWIKLFNVKIFKFVNMYFLF